MKYKMIVNAITAVIALGIGSNPQADTEMGKIPGMEKCYGVAKAGHNDCGTKNHTCAGEAKKNNDPNEWITLPNGTCQKIAGGTLQSSPTETTTTKA